MDKKLIIMFSLIAIAAIALFVIALLAIKYGYPLVALAIFGGVIMLGGCDVE